MVVRLPLDIEALVTARVDSGEFASAEEVVREAMAPWIARERGRIETLAYIRARIAEGDADETEYTAAQVREHLDRKAAALRDRGPDAA